MKICDKVFSCGIDIIVSPYHDISQKNICSELQSYLNDNKLSINIFGDNKTSICYMDIDQFFRSISNDIDNGAKDKYYFLNKYYMGSKSIVSEIKNYLDSNNDLLNLIIRNRIQIFVIIGADENFSFKDFNGYPYHFFYMTEAKDIFGKALLDTEDKEVWKGWTC